MCAGASAPKDRSSTFIFRPRRVLLFARRCVQVQVLVLVLVRVRVTVDGEVWWGPCPALHLPASGCIADLSSAPNAPWFVLCRVFFGGLPEEGAGNGWARQCGVGIGCAHQDTLQKVRNGPGARQWKSFRWRPGGHGIPAPPSCAVSRPLPIAGRESRRQTPFRSTAGTLQRTLQVQLALRRRTIRLWDLLHMHAGRKERRQEQEVVPNHSTAVCFILTSGLQKRGGTFIVSPPRPGIDGEQPAEGFCRSLHWPREPTKTPMHFSSPLRGSSGSSGQVATLRDFARLASEARV